MNKIESHELDKLIYVLSKELELLENAENTEIGIKEYRELLAKIKLEKMYREGYEAIEGMNEGSVLPLVPEGCLFCGSKWKGGCQVPGKPFSGVGLRVFYDCGASMSVRADLGDGAVYIFTKNCLETNK